MPGFRNDAPQGVYGWFRWVGDPNDDTAHQVILGWLQAQHTQFEGPNSTPSNSMKGNLGEFIAYGIGKHHVAPPQARAFTANAFDPMSNHSRTDIDILWVDLSTNPAQGSVTIQEVKTTGATSLSLADDLIADYEKLFGQNLKLTLRTRLSALKNKMNQQGLGNLTPRLTNIGGPSPGQTSGVRLWPTLVHDASVNSYAKMAAVQGAIIGLGWPAGVVESWSIELDDLDLRLTRLSRGQ